MATKKLQILDSLIKDAVLYTPQELTEEQRTLAKDNIGAASVQFITWEEDD